MAKSAGKIQEGIVGGDRAAKKIRDTAIVVTRSSVGVEKFGRIGKLNNKFPRIFATLELDWGLA
jgi:hypothetical protein